ncbi:14823_t:CDS:2 [Funneliformis geosporum]|uniref:14823_t:CDS:1 n=1 Tax=Funneliformis geosporum TaxID=1117311 RepID=A0A9W4T555_9GLOM|nr:14823_t:CDS:2 [Funneliformis geosporum]
MNDILNFSDIIYDENDNKNDVNTDENDINDASDIDDKPDSLLKDIYTGQTFTTFEVFEEYLKQYAKNRFLNKNSKYEPKKNVDPTHNRNQESACIGCGFLVNAAYCKCLNLVFINKFFNEHNHTLQSTIDLQEFSPISCKIPDDIMKEIQFYVQECHFAVVCDETVSTYEWILEQTIRVTEGLQPAIRFIDADPAMQVTISNKYPETILNNKWDDFIGEFYALRNSLVVSDFENRWAELMIKFPIFYANTHSTQRVERMPQVSSTIFKPIDEICKKYLTPNSLALQQKQMVEAFLYKTLFKEIRNMVLQDKNQYNIGFVEDDYEKPQILLDMTLKDCSNGFVKKIWKIKHIQSKTNRSQFIVLLDDGTHYCTCLYLIYAEFVLQTFFAVMLQSKIAQLNIKLIPSHWYSKEGLTTTENKALNLAIENKSIRTFEEVLQQFIKVQIDMMRNADQHNDILSETKITNPLQHKGKGRPANKRYLSAIKNNSNSKNGDIQEDTSRKRNKRQCFICKSWYHDSRNCPEKTKRIMLSLYMMT